jgi:putative membrane protein
MLQSVTFLCFSTRSSTMTTSEYSMEGLFVTTIFAFVLNCLTSALVIWLVAYLLPGVNISSFSTALWAALALSAVNTLIRPILSLISAPITFLTLGLFAFIVNAAMFGLAAWFVPGFEVNGLLWALLGSLLLGILTSITQKILPGQDSEPNTARY